jgi:hypothetical protein
MITVIDKKRDFHKAVVLELLVGIFVTVQIHNALPVS